MYAEFSVNEIGGNAGSVRVRVGHGEDAQVANGTWELVDGLLEMSPFKLACKAGEDYDDDQAVLEFRNEWRGKWRLALQVPYDFTMLRFTTDPEEIYYTLALKTDDGNWQNIGCTQYLTDGEFYPRFHLSCSDVPQILGLAEQVDKGVRWIREVWSDNEVPVVEVNLKVDLLDMAEEMVIQVENCKVKLEKAKGDYDLVLEDVETLKMATESLERLGVFDNGQVELVRRNLSPKRLTTPS